MKNKNTIIIAEAGVNHNGKISLAKKLIEKASDAKADFIKFQFFNPDNITTKWLKTANYQKKNTNAKTQYELLKKLYLPYKKLKLLEKFSKKRKIKFMLSIFDHENVKKINLFNIKYIKIPSGEINNHLLLKKIAKLKKKIILSTGGSELKEIREALITLKKNKLHISKISLLHCVSNYPSSFKSTNLKSIISLKNKFKCDVGLSDHSLGYSIPLAAVSLGAKIIEKHLTLSKKMKGPDHKASLEPKEFKKMVEEIKNIEIALGNKNKKIQKEEKENILLVRKSIVAKKNIKKGDKFSDYNLTLKRPGTGLTSKNWTKLIGTKSKKKFKKDDLITL